MESSVGSVPLPPLYSNPSFPITNNLLRGTGQLTWLSSKGGLITCSKPSPVTVSFQLKDFCDTAVSDLTLVLRVGFRLAFHASSPNDNNEWIANYVSPISDADLNSGVFNEAKEMDLEAIEQSSGSTTKPHKDPYTLKMEMESLSFLLSIFQKNAVHFIPLSSLHSRISNSGKEELYRYIGSSSLKRRQFIERRSYIFYIADNDVVFLQPSEIYMTVCILTGFLLSHGGVTSSDALFAFFNSSQLMPVPLKESIKGNRANFMAFLSRHPFAFAPFPSQYYVSVRRNLPYFDYETFIRKNFPNALNLHNSLSYGNPRGPLPSLGTFDHMNDNLSNVPPYHHTPTTPVTPLFQEDQLVVSQKAARASGWPNDMGYFDHQKTNNSLAGNMNGPIMGASGVPLSMGAGPKLPLVGGGPSSRAVNSMPLFGANEMPMPKMNDFSKVDVTRRPTDLNLMDLRQAPAVPPMLARKSVVDRFTQTDYTSDANYRNLSRVDRAVGSDIRCSCRCTCQWSQEQSRRQSSAESLNLSRTHSQMNNHFIDAESMRHRPISVQEQPIGALGQHPLFGNHVGPTPVTTAVTASLMLNVKNDTNDSAASNNIFGNMVKSLATGGCNDREFDVLHDSFFNYTMNAFTSNYMSNGSSLLNGNEYMGGVDLKLVGDPFLTNNGGSVIGQRRPAPKFVESSDLSALPMPIGVSSNSCNDVIPIANGVMLNGLTSIANNDLSVSTNGGNANGTVSSHYDPFGSALKLELPSLSSLKL